MGDFEFDLKPTPVEGVATLYAPRRTVLDALLVDAAREAGAVVRERALVRDVVRSGDRVVGVVTESAHGAKEEMRARVVVGADGMNSRIALAVGAGFDVHYAPITFSRYAFWADMPVGHFGSYRYADNRILEFPTHDGLTCIYVGWPMRELPVVGQNIEAAYLAAVHSVSVLASRLRNGRRVSQLVGSNRLANFIRKCWGPGWALVGDAACHQDPTTGMGIANAFAGAELLAAALRRGLAGDDAALDAALSRRVSWLCA